MKKLAVLCVSVVLCLPVGVASADPTAAFDQSPQMFLYLKLPVGLGSRNTERAQTGPRFGLSLNREFVWRADPLHNESSHWAHRSLPVVNLEFSARNRAFSISGVNASADGQSAWSNPWLWVGIAAGAVLISCATENFPCEDSDDGMGGGGY